MDIETLLEEIRTRLREAQEDCIADPWLYSDEELILAVRAAIRYLNVIGITVSAVLSLNGDFDTDPSLVQGMLLASKVAADLVLGDLTKKVNTGELGVNFRSVMDTYSTSEATRIMQGAADRYLQEFKTLLTIEMANSSDTASGVFGQQGTSFSDS